MCFMTAYSLPGIGIVAADTQANYPDGPQRFGGKLRRIPDGWAAVTGAAAIGVFGLRALERVGISDVEVARVAMIEATQHAFSVAVPGTIDPEQAEITRFYVLRETDNPFSLHTIYSDGHGDDKTPGDMRFEYNLSYFGMERFQEEVKAFMAEIIGQAGFNGPALIRAAGRMLEFAIAHGGESQMSDEIELGFTILERGRYIPLYLRAPVDWLVSASDSEILCRVSPFPKSGAFPSYPIENQMMTQTLTERR